MQLFNLRKVRFLIYLFYICVYVYVTPNATLEAHFSNVDRQNVLPVHSRIVRALSEHCWKLKSYKKTRYYYDNIRNIRKVQSLW